MISSHRPRVLFLTTQDPSSIVAEWPYYQNWTLPQALESQDACVSKLCWRDATTTIQKLATFDVISLLWCNNYHSYAKEFITFLEEVLIPATTYSPSLRVVNHAGIILWNVDKRTYLQDLLTHGFNVPRTTFVDCTDISIALLKEAIITFAADSSAPVVLKPSISGSSKMTHLVQNPHKFTAIDTAFLNDVVAVGMSGSLLIQAYEPAIMSGEYSMVFIDGVHTHTMIKTPCQGEFRCQAEFGGGIGQIPASLVPPDAIATAQKVIQHLQSKFPALDRESKGGAVYTRVDGVVRNDGKFVIMEIEAIEPHLWLETAFAPGCQDLLYAALLGKQVTQQNVVPIADAKEEKHPVIVVSEVGMVAV